MFGTSPNLNAFTERWVRSVKQECIAKLILCGERSLQGALTEFVAHYHLERNHQGKGNVLLFPAPVNATPRQRISLPRTSRRAYCGITAGRLEYFDHKGRCSCSAQKFGKT